MYITRDHAPQSKILTKYEHECSSSPFPVSRRRMANQLKGRNLLKKTELEDSTGPTCGCWVVTKSERHVPFVDHGKRLMLPDYM